MTEQLTLYTAKICPYAQRVELALREAKANYTPFQIDLKDKPEWYAPRVNPASKVPALTYGGPHTSPSEPSSESDKITESLVLLEFVADLFPSSSLLPKDPVRRAKARFFIDAVVNKYIPNYVGAVVRGEPANTILKGVEAIQELLPAEGFAIGPEYTIADASIAPIAARVHLALKNDLGAFKDGEGRKAFEALDGDPKYERYRKYFYDLTDRPSFKATFDEEYIKEAYYIRFKAPKQAV
jgi:glutathione S-transferase